MAPEPARWALEAEGLGRWFLRGAAARGPLPLRLAARALGLSARRPVWALRGVSLRLAPGECLGVIGRNGAGKSTLLSLLAGLLPPSEGRARRAGRAVLLQPGAGLFPDLTVLENLRLACALYGLGRERWRARRGEIARFGGLQGLLDARLDELSLGTQARVAFCAAVHSEPAILLADEAQAVGDAEFSARCLERVEELRRGGTAVVLASHDLDLVAARCDRAILLDGGRVLAEGAPEAVVSSYLDALRRSAGQALA